MGGGVEANPLHGTTLVQLARSTSAKFPSTAFCRRVSGRSGLATAAKSEESKEAVLSNITFQKRAGRLGCLRRECHAVIPTQPTEAGRRGRMKQRPKQFWENLCAFYVKNAQTLAS